jgi:hypothetical protein
MEHVRLNKTKLEQIIRTNPARLEAFLRAVATEMTSDIVLSFGSSPPGRTYRRRGTAHVASRAGYPPNVDTGTLRASMRWKPMGKLTIHIVDGVEYGIHLEQGTERIEARPFVAPVFFAWRRRRLAAFAREWGLLR